MGDQHEAIGIGVIGCGDIAAMRHIPTIAGFPGVRLAALCDADINRARQLAADYEVPLAVADYKQLLQLDEVDAVVIATPPWITPYIAIDCLHAGRHVLCEKPMAVDVATANKVREVELATGKRVQVGFTYRHGLLLETLRGWIADGRLGAPLVFRIGVFDETWDPEGSPEHYARIYRTMQHGSPSIHDGAHVADFLHFLTGSTVVGVEALGFKSREEFPSSNYDLAIVRFANGDLAKVEIGWFFPVFPTGEFEVLGPRGIAIFDRTAQFVRLQTDKGVETVTLDEDWGQSCFRIQLDRFIAGIRLDRPFVPGTAEGIASLSLTKAIEAAIARTEP